MALDPKLRQSLEGALAVVDAHGLAGPRLVDDARRLIERVRGLVAEGVITLPDGGPGPAALELAGYATQLPLGKSRPPLTRRGRTSLRDRCEEAAELLVVEVGALIDEPLLDLAARILREAPHHSPMLDEARLLADAMNLDDFGIIGLARLMLDRALQGQGVQQLAEGMARREDYSYWDARLKDGFHFDAVRKIARERLTHARQAARWLAAELADDGVTLRDPSGPGS